jgi:MFS family permease
MSQSGIQEDDRRQSPRQSSSSHVQAALLQDGTSCADPVLYPARWLSLTQFCLLNGGNAMQWVSFSIVLDQSKAFFDMTTAEINWLVIIYEVIFAMLAPFIMYLFDRYGLRGGLRIGSVFNTIGVVLRFVAVLWGRNFALVMVSQCFFSVTMVFAFPAPPILAARWFGERERGFATAIGAMSNSIGLALGQLIPPLIISDSTNTESSWLILFAVLGAYAIVESVLIFGVLPSGPPTPPSASQDVKALRPEARPVPTDANLVSMPIYGAVSATDDASDSDAEGAEDGNRRGLQESADRRESSADTRRSTIASSVHNRSSTWGELWKMFKIPSFVGLFWSCGIFFGCQWGVIALLPQLLKPFGVDEATVGWMGFVNVIVGASLAMPLSKLIDRFRIYHQPLSGVLAGCTIGYLAFSLILLLDPPHLVPILFVVYTLLGITQAFAIPLFFEFCVEITFPVDEALSTTAIMWAGNTLSVPLMFGLPEIIGSTATKESAVAAMGALAAAGLVATLLIAVPRPTLQRLEYERACTEEKVASSHAE